MAQLANSVALEMDSQRIATMSCIAGVAGNVPDLVKFAKSGRPIIALDGCDSACVTHCLAHHQIKPEYHLVMTELGYVKRARSLFGQQEKAHVMGKVNELLLLENGNEPTLSEIS